MNSKEQRDWLNKIYQEQGIDIDYSTAEGVLILITIVVYHLIHN